MYYSWGRGEHNMQDHAKARKILEKAGFEGAALDEADALMTSTGIALMIARALSRLVERDGLSPAAAVRSLRQILREQDLLSD